MLILACLGLPQASKRETPTVLAEDPGWRILNFCECELFCDGGGNSFGSYRSFIDVIYTYDIYVYDHAPFG